MAIIWGGHQEEEPRSLFRRVLAWFILGLCLALLVAMVLPAIRTGGCRGGRIPHCGNNQRQVVLSMLVYANDYDNKWPAFVPTGLVGRIRSPHDARIVASRSMEMTAIMTGGDLTNRILSCPSKPTVMPTLAPSLGRDDGQWGASATSAVAYAYDWAAPSDSMTARVVLADRDSSNHPKQPIACFADGHVGSLEYIRPTLAGWRTEGSDGAPVPVMAINRDAGTDDIYSPLDDGPGFLSIGQASSTRAWVK